MSETRMRELRRTVRNTLGVSRDRAPELGQVLRSARAVSEMLDIRSGRYRMVLLDKHTGQYIKPTDALAEYTAAVNEQERIRHEQRMAELRAQREGQG